MLIPGFKPGSHFFDRVVVLSVLDFFIASLLCFAIIVARTDPQLHLPGILSFVFGKRRIFIA